MKVLIIGDLHFGEKGDSEKFNKRVLDFLRWSCGVADENNAKAVVQLGDWFHQRNKINVETLNYGISGAKILGEKFGRENSFVLAGNHDLHYLDRLDVSSLAVLDPYVTVIDEFTTIFGNCLASPWIATGEMWDQLIEHSLNHRHLFAHLELNGFMVNERYEMEHGRSHRELKRFETVITGHYHSMQDKDNILYTGTPYPITMNEANEDHGVFIFDTETAQIDFFPYEAIKVISIPYDQIDLIESLDPETTSIRIEFPDVVEDEQVVEDVKNRLMAMNFDEVKVKYTGKKVKEIMDSDISSVESVENIDQCVVSHLKNSVTVEGVDSVMLADLYNEAVQRSK